MQSEYLCVNHSRFAGDWSSPLVVVSLAGDAAPPSGEILESLASSQLWLGRSWLILRTVCPSWWNADISV